eukprot:8740829-Lingulodinium_polyedra.AAC.1
MTASTFSGPARCRSEGRAGVSSTRRREHAVGLGAFAGIGAASKAGARDVPILLGSPWPQRFAPAYE